MTKPTKISPAIGKQNAEEPTLKVTRTHGEILYAPTTTTIAADLRFTSFVRSIATGKAFRSLDIAERVVMCSIAFDGILTKQDLVHYLGALSDAQTWGSRSYVTWSISGRCLRRAPSSMTLISFAPLRGMQIDWEVVVDKMGQTLQKQYSFNQLIPCHQALDSVLDDCQAWLYLRLPNPLFAHVRGDVEMTALPSACWHRRFQLQRDPILAVKERSSAGEDLQEVASRVVETLWAGVYQSGAAEFLLELKTLCRDLTGTGIRLSNEKAWKKVVSRLELLGQKMQDKGPYEALLLGWVLDIAVRGTARKANPVVATLAKYLQSAAERLHCALRAANKSPLAMCTEDWDGFFRKLIGESDDDPALAPSLASFQRYLVSALDAEPLPWLFAPKSSHRLPRANVVWPHEFEALREALPAFTQNTRIVHQLETWNAILAATSLRLGELLGLLLRSIQDHGSSMEIVIERGKTPSARRIVQITRPESIVVIRGWVSNRRIEATRSDELLFGHAHSGDRVYMLGTCYHVFSQALKHVCRDATVTIHTTRHTYLSVGVERAIEGMDVFHEINPLLGLSTSAGHAHVFTTMTTYAHLYEDVLRNWTDAAVAQVPISHASVATWTGKKANTVRQKACRTISGQWNGWTEIRRRAELLQPDSRVAAARPSNDGIVSNANSSAPASTICHVIADHCNGHSAEASSLRNVTSRDSVNKIVAGFHRLNNLVPRGAASYPDVCQAAHISHKWIKNNLSFARLDRPTWVNALRLLDTAEWRDRSKISARWAAAVSGPGIALHDQEAVTTLLQLLSAAGVPVNWFVIRLTDVASGVAHKEDSISRAVDAASQPFSRVYEASPQVEKLASKQGARTMRFRSYALLLSSPSPEGKAAPPALCDMKALRAFCFAAATHASILESTTTFSSNV